eukprot:scaffold7760_cov286-Pinguiococcus_pyrenoidosus.AAC.5
MSGNRRCCDGREWQGFPVLRPTPTKPLAAASGDRGGKGIGALFVPRSQLIEREYSTLRFLQSDTVALRERQQLIS